MTTTNTTKQQLELSNVNRVCTPGKLWKWCRLRPLWKRRWLFQLSHSFGCGWL